jgi:hypothetical protein
MSSSRGFSMDSPSRVAIFAPTPSTVKGRVNQCVGAMSRHATDMPQPASDDETIRSGATSRTWSHMISHRAHAEPS